MSDVRSKRLKLWRNGANCFAQSTLAILILSGAIVLSPHIYADDNYSLSITGATTDAVSGQLIYSVDGQVRPTIPVAVQFAANSAVPTITYDSLSLYINGSQKTAWTGVQGQGSFTNTYNWSLCSGNDQYTGGQAMVELKGVSNSFPVDQSLATINFGISGNYTCTTGSGIDNTLIINAAVQSSAKQVVTSLHSSISEQELCNNYNVRLYATPNTVGTGETNPTFDKGLFCSPSSPTIQDVTWNTTGTSPGNYLLQARALAIDSSKSNIYSSTVGVTIDAQGGASGGSGSGSGTGTSTSGSASSAVTSSPNLNPINLLLPDPTVFRGKSGLDLRFGILQFILNIILTVVSIFAIVSLLISGIMYGLSFGDPSKAERAKKSFVFSIYGIICILLSYTFIVVISGLLHTVK